MDGFNNAGDFSLDQVLVKRLVTPGGSVAPGVAPELMPCLVLESDRPEWQWLYGGGRFGRGGSVAAGGAGTRTSLSIVNPREDTLTVVEAVDITVGSGQVLARLDVTALGALPFGTAVQGRSVDTRNRTQASGNNTAQAVTSVISDNTLATITSAVIAQSGSTTLELRQPVILGPGGRLYLSPSADNVAITAFTVFFRERRLNQSERL